MFDWIAEHGDLIDSIARYVGMAIVIGWIAANIFSKKVRDKFFPKP